MKILAPVYGLDKDDKYIKTGTRELDLEPCPFCGHEPEASITGLTVMIGCPVCDIAMEYPRSIEEGVNQWNRRISPPSTRN